MTAIRMCGKQVFPARTAFRREGPTLGYRTPAVTLAETVASTG
jgi:hypothetical protein